MDAQMRDSLGQPDCADWQALTMQFDKGGQKLLLLLRCCNAVGAIFKILQPNDNVLLFVQVEIIQITQILHHVRQMSSES